MLKNSYEGISKLIGQNPSINHDDFLDVMDAITTSNSIKTLVERCQNATVYKYGSYHHIPAFGSQNYNNLNRFWATGLDNQVLEYLRTCGKDTDPVMSYVFAKARPYWLSDLYESDDFSGEYSQRRMKLALDYVGDGILAPLFGPYHKRGYVFVGFEKPSEFFDEVFIWQIQAILQAVHVRYCKLVGSHRTSVRLTKRENEVLELISFGKTNPEIGAILGISTNTVSGYVKRIFLKFDARDRVTVALRAQSLIFSEPIISNKSENIHNNAI